MRIDFLNNYEIDSDGYLYNKRTKKNNYGVYNPIYKRVRLNIRIEGTQKTFYLHKLIAKAFIPDYNDQLDKIKFIDGNYKNCSLNNLKIIKMEN